MGRYTRHTGSGEVVPERYLGRFLIGDNVILMSHCLRIVS